MSKGYTLIMDELFEIILENKNACRLMIYFLKIKENKTEGMLLRQGYRIKKNQCCIGREFIKKELKIGDSAYYDGLEFLFNKGVVEIEATSIGTIITINGKFLKKSEKSEADWYTQPSTPHSDEHPYLDAPDVLNQVHLNPSVEGTSHYNITTLVREKEKNEISLLENIENTKAVEIVKPKTMVSLPVEELSPGSEYLVLGEGGTPQLANPPLNLKDQARACATIYRQTAAIVLGIDFKETLGPSLHDEERIARAVKLRGFNFVACAIYGAQFEKEFEGKSKLNKFNPKDHFSLRRILDDRFIEKFANKGNEVLVKQRRPIDEIE